MKKVLVVEDLDCYFDNINRELKGKVEVIHAKTLEEGENLFSCNPDIELIIMDACVPGSEPNSMPLIKKIIDAGFVGPIIAASSLRQYSKQLREAGATHESTKDGAAQMAIRLLNLLAS